MIGENDWLDSVMGKILDVILMGVQTVVNFIFSSHFVTFLFWYILMNAIAIVLMKKDKQYAKEEKRRIRESTLLAVAFAGGGLGMYFAMYRYKHKTLHKKFTIGVPVAIVIHFALVSYMVVSSWLS